ncbi:hypothetical protein OS493_014598 [Desmophyllum pertusum]|uniref:Uncharacterized protein n=1 Tax=Desmophyllum pertusum TaxID=174260 RepID=A0A9W9YPY8_9CNID|nr:hypothetical protein OS493_014598 [Desmophyllum pertusum]
MLESDSLKNLSEDDHWRFRTSGPLYLAIIQRPKPKGWYSKSRMGEHKLGRIMKTLAQSLNFDGKIISNHSTRKSIVAKLKKSGQPRHKIIQITVHASESSLNDYDRRSIQNYFDPQSTDELGSTSGSSRVDCVECEIASSAKRRRPYIIESDED